MLSCSVFTNLRFNEGGVCVCWCVRVLVYCVGVLVRCVWACVVRVGVCWGVLQIRQSDCSKSGPSWPRSRPCGVIRVVVVLAHHFHNKMEALHPVDLASANSTTQLYSYKCHNKLLLEHFLLLEV